MSRAITIRLAAPEDAGLVLRLIRALAVYEKAPEAVVATEADLVRHGFGPDRQFEAILALARPARDVSRRPLRRRRGARARRWSPADGSLGHDRGRTQLGPDRFSGARLEPGAQFLSPSRDGASRRLAALRRRHRNTPPPCRGGRC